MVLVVFPARMLLRGVPNERRSYTKRAPSLARLLFLSRISSKPSRICFLHAPEAKTLDATPPWGSKITLSPRRRAIFLKIKCFPMDSFPA